MLLRNSTAQILGGHMTDTDTTPVKPASRRDQTAALQAAEEIVARAQRMQTAVVDFHKAAEKIDQAKILSDEGSRARLVALLALRDCQLPVSQISDLTGLSASRIQALLRDNSGGDS
jgi:hypothetical protein